MNFNRFIFTINLKKKRFLFFLLFKHFIIFKNNLFYFFCPKIKQKRPNQNNKQFKKTRMAYKLVK